MDDLDGFTGFEESQETDENIYDRLFSGEEETNSNEPEKIDYKALFDQQKEAIESLKTEVERTKQQAFARTEQPVQQQRSGLFDGAPQQNTAQLFDQLVVEKGVGGALAAMYEMARQDAAKSAQANLFPVASQTALFAIDNYRRTANFISEDHVAEFDKLVSKFTPEQLASVDPRTIHAQLAEVDDLAYGKAAKRGKTTRANQPPLYATGSVGGGFGSPGKGSVGRKFSEKERAVLQAGKDSGLNDKDLAEIIRDMRSESGE